MGQSRRRRFLIAAGALVVAPLAVAQRQGRKYRIGFLAGGSRPESLDSSPYAGFTQGMRELGYVEGRNFVSVNGRKSIWSRDSRGAASGRHRPQIRPQPLAASIRLHPLAMASISTRAPATSPAAWNVVRAGGSFGKYPLKTSFIAMSSPRSAM